MSTIPTPPADLIDCADLREHVETLSVALARWAYRDDTGPEVRQVANLAVDTIDAALANLQRTRSRLVGQIRRYDDATAARRDALLARLREERGQQ